MRRLFFFACAGALFVAGAGADEGSTMRQHSYDEELARIEQMAKSKDLAGLERMMDEIHRKWRRRDAESYAALILSAVSRLNVVGMDEPEDPALVHDHIMLALEKADEMSIQTHFKLVCHLQHHPRHGSVVSLGECRTQAAREWMCAWKRVHDELSPDWNPSDEPRSNIAPPAATGLPSGVAPEAIEDPTLRAEYEAAIEKNNQKAEQYSKQYQLRKVEARLLKKAEDYLINAYSTPPYDITELGQYLTQYVSDEKVRARITDEVIQRMSEGGKKPGE